MSRLTNTPVVILALGMSLPGCAIQTAHLNVSQWPMAKRAMYYSQPLPYRLAVVPMVDQRPELERSGKRAPGMFLLLWNRRVGDYYTGDHVFGHKVAGRLSEQLVEYFRAANLFSSVELANMPPEHPSALHAPRVQSIAEASAADYVMAGEVEHFFGSQHQHLSMYVLPLYFINMSGWQDSKSLPWGRSTIHVTLYDGRSGDLIWRQRLEAEHTMPRESAQMSEAALESFTALAGQLSGELRRLPFESLGSPMESRHAEKNW